jgi:hypothetical protein
MILRSPPDMALERWSRLVARAWAGRGVRT